MRRELGRAKIVVSDLIPLLKTYAEDNSLFELVMRLLMNLTQPAIICFRNEIPKDKIRLGYFLELESILREYKLVSGISISFIVFIRQKYLPTDANCSTVFPLEFHCLVLRI